MQSGDSTGSRDAILEFLRREAPIEWERLASIGRLVEGENPANGGGPSRDVKDTSHAGWLRETYGMFTCRSTCASL